MGVSLSGKKQELCLENRLRLQLGIPSRVGIRNFRSSDIRHTHRLHQHQHPVPATYAYLLAQILIVILVTYLTIIFGELVPKRIGMSVSTRAAKLLARPMYWLSIIASPFVWLLAKSTSLIFNLLHINTAEEKVTEEEIRSMIDEGTENGEVQEVEDRKSTRLNSSHRT